MWFDWKLRKHLCNQIQNSFCSFFTHISPGLVACAKSMKMGNEGDEVAIRDRETNPGPLTQKPAC